MTTPSSDFLPPRIGSRPDAEERMVPRIVRLFSPYRLQVAVVLVFILATASLGVVNPVLIKVVFDQGLFRKAAGPTSDCCGFWAV